MFGRHRSYTVFVARSASVKRLSPRPYTAAVLSEPIMRPGTLLLLLLTISPTFAQPKTPDPATLTLDRIFVSAEFRGDRAPKNLA